MTSTDTLLSRNNRFASAFAHQDLPILPKLRTVILACADARVDPAHVLGLDLGDSVVIRNTGARVTPEVIHEIAALTFMVSKMEGDKPGRFELVIVQHTQCGAERFADPGMQHALKAHCGVDVAPLAITDHEQSIRDDIERLRSAAEIPGYVVVSGYVYDVRDGRMREVASPAALAV
jgi:carbonic anhydrase